MALSLSDIKRGTKIVIDGDPYIVMYTKHVHMGRGGATLQTKLRNLKNGKILEQSFKAGDNVEEADMRKKSAVFAYAKRDEYWFHEEGSPSERFELDKDILGDQAQFLKPKMKVTALLFDGEIINVDLPIKVDYKVIETPPNVKGGTAQGGNKIATIEGGAKINVPMFVEVGDRIRVNTETEEYVERA